MPGITDRNLSNAVTDSNIAELRVLAGGDARPGRRLVSGGCGFETRYLSLPTGLELVGHEEPAGNPVTVVKAR